MLLVALNMPFIGKCQYKNNIELSFIASYCRQAHYSTQYGNVSYVNKLKLYGTNLSTVIDYKRELYYKTYLKIGLGYLRFAANKISNETHAGNSLTTTDARPINYPSTIFLLYSTTKYAYNNFLFHFGIEKYLNISERLPFAIGVDYFHADKLSQSYYIPDIRGKYRTKNKGNFGDFVNLDLSLCKKRLGNISLTPALVVPVYNSWRQDIVFKENPNKTIANWFSGIGLTLSISYH